MSAMSVTKRVVVAALGLWLSLGVAGSAAHAQDPRPAKVTRSDEASRRVRIDALVVHASNQGTAVDPRLKGLNRSRFPYTSYKVLSSHTETVSPGQTATVSAVGGRKLRVAFIERTAQGAKVRIQLFVGSEKKLDTTASLVRDRAFLVAGPKHDGGVLMFPITVSY